MLLPLLNEHATLSNSKTGTFLPVNLKRVEVSVVSNKQVHSYQDSYQNNESLFYATILVVPLLKQRCRKCLQILQSVSNNSIFLIFANCTYFTIFYTDYYKKILKGTLQQHKNMACSSTATGVQEKYACLLQNNLKKIQLGCIILHIHYTSYLIFNVKIIHELSNIFP